MNTPVDLEVALAGWHVAAQLRSVIDGTRHDALHTAPTVTNLAAILGTTLARIEAIARSLNDVEVEL